MLHPSCFILLLFGLLFSEFSVVDVNGGLCDTKTNLGFDSNNIKDFFTKTQAWIGQSTNGLVNGNWSLCGRKDREKIEPEILTKKQAGKTPAKKSTKLAETTKPSNNVQPDPLLASSTKPSTVPTDNKATGNVGASEVKSGLKEAANNDKRETEGVQKPKTAAPTARKSSSPSKETPKVTNAPEPKQMTPTPPKVPSVQPNPSKATPQNQTQSAKVTTAPKPQVPKSPSFSKVPVPAQQKTSAPSQPNQVIKVTVTSTTPPESVAATPQVRVIPVQQKPPTPPKTVPVQEKTQPAASQVRQPSPKVASTVKPPVKFPVTQKTTPPKTAPGSTLSQERIIDINFNKAVQDAKRFRRTPYAFDQQDLYALYQQAIVGDNRTPRPSMFDFNRTAYWSAWLRRKGMTRMKAKEEYAKKVRGLAVSVGLK